MSGYDTRHSARSFGGPLRGASVPIDGRGCLLGAVAKRRLDGSRGLQPTVAAGPKSILGRGATPEIGQGWIHASLHDACGWAAPEPWVKTHRYHQSTAPRCLDVGWGCDAGFASAGFQPARPVEYSCARPLGM